MLLWRDNLSFNGEQKHMKRLAFAFVGAAALTLAGCNSGNQDQVNNAELNQPTTLDDCSSRPANDAANDAANAQAAALGQQEATTAQPTDADDRRERSNRDATGAERRGGISLSRRQADDRRGDPRRHIDRRPRCRRRPPEMLMVERAEGMAFAAGALVFPGGRIDEADRALGASAGDRCAAVAAIRETVEETAVPVGLTPVPGPATQRWRFSASWSPTSRSTSCWTRPASRSIPLR